MKITYFAWRYVEKYDFYDIRYIVDDYAKTRIYVNKSDVDALDMTPPDAVAWWLRATLECTPEEKPGRNRG